MANYKTTEGIILARIEFKDTDGIFSVFTKEHGKISVIAKGIKKPKSKFSAFLRIGSILNLDLVGDLEKMPVIKGVKVYFYRRVFLTKSWFFLRKLSSLLKISVRKGTSWEDSMNC